MSSENAEQTAETVLAGRIGLDPRTVGDAAIQRALHARMSCLGLDDRDAYLRLLARSEHEQQELVEEVVVPESWFFRDEAPFATLREYAAHARRDRPTRPLRVLSIPCGCGEESYSIAITLLDLGLTPEHFHIDAVDVSARHLAAAGRGVYRGNSFRGSNLAFRDRHFHPDARRQSFTLDPAVRRTVQFLRGNLLDPHLLSGHSPYDVIFCRNVLIYLDEAARRRTLDSLHRLLLPTGILFVGHAERLAIDDPRFEPYGENASFALRLAQPRVRTTPSPLSPWERVPEGRVGAKSHRVLQQPLSPWERVPEGRVRAEAQPSASASASTRVRAATPEAPVALPESSALWLADAARLADQGRSDEAAARCEAVLARFGPSAPALFLLGLVQQSTGRLADAEACFRKAVYLDPGHDEALFTLALCAERRGDTHTAARYRRRAERARAKRANS
jgi:chemotaxis protein methyltransferase WspC